jgi:methyl-accepting chemotaxis protein
MAQSDTTTSTVPKFQRRTVLIKRALQLKYVAMVFVAALFASLLVGLDIYYTMAKMVLTENPAMSTTVAQFHTIIFVKIVLYLVIILLISLYVSHRFAGPIHRFEKSAQAVASGDLTHRVSLRTGDELLELQEEFNGMLANLQSLVQKDRNLASRLSQRVSQAMKKVPDDKHGEALREELSDIKSELDHLTKAFKV